MCRKLRYQLFVQFSCMSFAKAIGERNQFVLFSLVLSYSLFGPICFVWFQLLDCILDIHKNSFNIRICSDSKNQLLGIKCVCSATQFIQQLDHTRQ
jgi:hypothetical protein